VNGPSRHGVIPMSAAAEAPPGTRALRADGYEGDLMVKGTDDIAAAVDFLQTWHDPDAAWNGWQCDTHLTSDCDCPTDTHRKPDDARTRWFRYVPGCPEWCGQGHRYHLHDAEPHARGAFPAVYWWCA
jgi:hypothetical protein